MLKFIKYKTIEEVEAFFEKNKNKEGVSIQFKDLVVDKTGYVLIVYIEGRQNIEY